MVILCGLGLLYLESKLPDVDALRDIRLQIPLRIYTSDGQLIAEYGEIKRLPVQYHELPPMLIKAIIATEDQRFFDHPGVDIMGLGRAALHVIRTGTKGQGGSTITMQVARNFFLSRKKTYLRKINEILLALKIDHELSKEKILALYFNKIYLGHRAYGVGAAAQTYYGRALGDLTLPQLAMLAGLPKAPSSLNPLTNPTAAKKRRNHVLNRLLQENLIDRVTYEQATKTPITAQYHGMQTTIEAPFVAEMVRQSMIDQFGTQAYSDGYRVYTTIDSKLQLTANQTLRQGLLAYDQRHSYRGPQAHRPLDPNEPIESIQKYLNQLPKIPDLIPAIITDYHHDFFHLITPTQTDLRLPSAAFQWTKKALKPGDAIYLKSGQLAQPPEIEGALVSVAPQDGAIKALVGGYAFDKSNYNRATQARRQPGSAFKPFIYAAALSQGMNLATIINDAPVVLNDPSLEGLWRPQNSNKRFHGPTRLRNGLVYSRNLVSIRVLDLTGIPETIKFLAHLGFSTQDIPHSLSLALGSLLLTPLELARHYAIFANGGYQIDPYVIQSVQNAQGKTILKAAPTPPQQVLEPGLAYLMDDVLRDVVARGTGRGARVLERQDIGGKTGTTNDHLDTWFAGYNPNLVTTVWVGYDKPKTMKEYAVKVALPIWVNFMRVALEGLPEQPRQRPNNLITMRIDPKTGLAASEHTQDAIFETFRRDQAPSALSPSIHEDNALADELF